MNRYTLFSLISLFLVMSIGFSSCKRDDPVLEDDQEEFDSVELLFTLIGNPEQTVKVVFNRFGSPEQEKYKFLKNEKYKMDIYLFHDGEDITPEVEDESLEHQFFFFAPASAVTDYSYQDNQLGLKGIIQFGNASSQFNLKILLRHGLNKKHPSAQLWNSPNYIEAGGVDDLSFSVPISLE